LSAVRRYFARPRLPPLFGSRWYRPDDTERIAAFGMPYDLGNAVAPGTREAPARLRSISADHRMAAGDALVDLGDFRLVAGEDPAVILERLGDAAEAIAGEGLLPLMIGGDHSITCPVVERLQRREEIVVLWLDAHTDFHPWDGRGGHSHKQVLRCIARLPNVRRVVQVGFRGYTIEDELYMAEPLRVLRPIDLRCGGASVLLAELPPGLACYLSLDVDVLDPAYAPATSTPVPGGFTPAEMETLLGDLLREVDLCGLDLVEVNPSRDVAARTGLVACRLLLTAAAAIASRMRRGEARRRRRAAPWRPSP